jgi:hypothetical protein
VGGIACCRCDEAVDTDFCVDRSSRAELENSPKTFSDPLLSGGSVWQFSGKRSRVDILMWYKNLKTAVFVVSRERSKMQNDGQ